jgi:4-carboxymuconolactone decarboxylase|tara:strand:- start:27526 stop:28095 length:570 start_codon:yes stop_codon:yes gene_type:complete
MSRLEPLDEDLLSADQKKLRDVVVGTRKGLGPNVWKSGPFGVWQHAPDLGLKAVELGAQVRFATELNPQMREVAICCVGVHFKSKFEFEAHAALAISEGIDSSHLDVLAEGGQPDWKWELIITQKFTEELLQSARVSDSTYGAMLREIGEKALVELVSTIGYYCLVSLTLNVFQVDLADSMIDRWPEEI